MNEAALGWGERVWFPSNSPLLDGRIGRLTPRGTEQRRAPLWEKTMGVFRRPELEKDNPVAPQLYVGPRRRQKLFRDAEHDLSAGGDPLAETLRTLSRAAKRFADSVPTLRNNQKERAALLKAIAEANRLLLKE
ncbi:MAG: hypothetical protein NNA22_01660 [Nitrospira sp.]|nr:hypothetical protein [Nitrospira sp.]